MNMNRVSFVLILLGFGAWGCTDGEHSNGSTAPEKTLVKKESYRKTAYEVANRMKPIFDHLQKTGKEGDIDFKSLKKNKSLVASPTGTGNWVEEEHRTGRQLFDTWAVDKLLVYKPSVVFHFEDLDLFCGIYPKKSATGVTYKAGWLFFRVLSEKEPLLNHTDIDGNKTYLYMGEYAVIMVEKIDGITFSEPE